jgi:hypothetical protein
MSDFMASNTNPTNDVLQSHTHEKLSAEQIAKAVARHNKEHKGGAPAAGQNPKAGQKKQGKH